MKAYRGIRYQEPRFCWLVYLPVAAFEVENEAEANKLIDNHLDS